MFRHHGQSRIRRCAALALVVAVAVSCGDDDEASSDATAVTAAPAATNSVPETAAFPVTIEHAFGTTTVPAEPQRVVVAGLNEADYLYSLGHRPGRRARVVGRVPVRHRPWADAARAASSAPSPRCSTASTSTSEWVASLDPDLIVVTYHDIDQTMYDHALEDRPGRRARPADVRAWRDAVARAAPPDRRPPSAAANGPRR